MEKENGGSGTAIGSGGGRGASFVGHPKGGIIITAGARHGVHGDLRYDENYKQFVKELLDSPSASFVEHHSKKHAELNSWRLERDTSAYTRVIRLFKSKRAADERVTEQNVAKPAPEVPRTNKFKNGVDLVAYLSLSPKSAEGFIGDLNEQEPVLIAKYGRKIALAMRCWQMILLLGRALPFKLLELLGLGQVVKYFLR